MTFDSKRLQYDREHIYIFEMDLDKCILTHGTAPCTATETGDDKCFNTQHTCNDLANYDSTIDTGAQTISVNATNGTFTRSAGSYITDGFLVDKKASMLGHVNAENNSTFIITTLTATVLTVKDKTRLVTETGSGDESVTQRNVLTVRMCEERSPQPLGLDAIPSMSRVSMSPSKIDLKGGLGVRANFSATFLDHPDAEIDTDPYLSDRTYDPLDRSSYWVKLRARNPNYQFRESRLLSGYLESDGSYDASNFQTRTYLVDKLDASNGSTRIVSKDPLKLASKNKAQIPAPSLGKVTDNPLSSSNTTINVTTGEGSNYLSSGTNYVLIGNEVVSYTGTTANTLTGATRGQFNTTATTHPTNDSVQQCFYANDTVDAIVFDMLTNYANVSPAFIPLTEWESEVSTHISGLLDGIIVKPMDVNKALKEIAEAAPHYLWWDEISSKIKLTALKAPPATAEVLDMDKHLIANSVRVSDQPDMRISTIFVNFGQFDPTKSLDEVGNFTQSYLRADTDSITKYDSSLVKTINSRWIKNTNLALAKKLASLIGRRFSNIPREVKFSMDAKDSDVWLGTTRSLNYRDIVDFNGQPQDTIFQITSAKEGEVYDYEGLEFDYGDELGSDPATGDEVYLVSAENVDMLAEYETLFTAVSGRAVTVTFYIQTGKTISSATTATPALDTGDWSAATSADITLIIESGGYVVGKGGYGGTSASVAGLPGGTGLNLQEDITLDNAGIIGGGGGGGGGDSVLSTFAGGGGGAGYGDGAPSFEKFTSSINGEDGTRVSGGAGGETTVVFGGDGGNLGVAGTASGSAAGALGVAIVKNGNTITESGSGKGDFRTTET